MIHRLALAALFLAMASGCTREPGPYADRARALAQEAIIVDGHVDVPYRMTEWTEDVSRRTIGGDFDAVRARAGGLDAPFMSIYIPSELQAAPGRSSALADSLINLVEGFVMRAPETFALALSVADVRANHAAGRISLPMGMENGSPVAEAPESLRYWFDRGIRYITLAHALANGLSDAAYDPNRPSNGLSELGERTVGEMNRLGIMVDVSHLSDSAFYDVIRVSRAPVIASHSSVRAFTPGWERNMGDAEIVALAGSGGVIMINFGSAFLRSRYLSAGDSIRAVIDTEVAARGLLGEEAERYRAQRRRSAPVGTVDDVVAHINHVRDLVGTGAIGLGSDFDGVFALPAGLQDVSEYPVLIEALLREGYTEDEVRGILGENLLRVWTEVERIAADS